MIKGINNKLILNEETMKKIVQEYLNKNVPETILEVTEVKRQPNHLAGTAEMFEVSFKAEGEG